MRILIAEDERVTRLKLRRQLEKMGHAVVESGDGREAWECFQAEPFSIVISDWEMPEMNGIDLVRRIRAAETDGYVYCVLLTGKSDKKDVVVGMEAGADDFISKPFDRDELRARLNAGQRIIELEQHLGHANSRLRHELAVAHELADAEHRKHEEALLGDSIPARALRESIERYADGDDPLLLTGPTGARQEVVARAVHRSSPRCDRPFIYVACAHLAGQDGSIFGFGQGDDDRTNLAKASLADGGTLYLEGIETLSMEVQAKLCQFVEDADNCRAAGVTPVPDIRVIASLTDRGSDDSVCVVEPSLQRTLGRNRLSVPSLAERRDDIVTIAQHVLRARATSSGKVIDGFTEEAERMLRQYSWPGNLRELRSVIERAVLLASGTKVDIPSDLLQEGRRVGGYTLQRQIGKGGMGEVWLAEHALLARPSAVKLIRERVVHADAATREMLRERFQREAKATARLRSPHTVELYDFGITDEGDFYYVMEYLKGIDLHRLIREHGPLPPARAIYLIQQACLSLEEAHRAGLVHRDVKPANLFVCELGTQDDFVKLLDFGIVRSTGSVDQSADETAGSTGMVKGTPACISPEAANGEKATSASDIYSLGCVAFTLLTGGDVFVAKSILRLLMKHVSEQPRAPSHYRPDLPDGLDELVLSCLSKDPKERPTAKQLRESLGTIAVDQPWDNEQATQWWSAHPVHREFSSGEKDETVATNFTESTSEIPGKHPTETDLRRWIDGALSQSRTTTIDQHLESCELCAEKIGQLSVDDRFVDHLRDVMSAADDNSPGGDD